MIRTVVPSLNHSLSVHWMDLSLLVPLHGSQLLTQLLGEVWHQNNSTPNGSIIDIRA